MLVLSACTIRLDIGVDVNEDESGTFALFMGFDEEFIRMWEYYLHYSEGGFRERIISTVQLAFAKPGYRFEKASY